MLLFIFIYKHQVVTLLSCYPEEFNNQKMLIRPLLSLYVKTSLIRVFCIYFTLRLLQKCLPGVALGQRASPVNFCSFNYSPGLPVVNLCWHAVFLIHLAVPAGHFQETLNIGRQYRCLMVCLPPSFCMCELGCASVTLCVVCPCVCVCGLHLQRENARHWGMALGSFSCRPMVLGWG